MALPNMSNSMYVARLRYIQSVRETRERRNPDVLVRYFLPLRQRIGVRLLRADELKRLRSDPFYYYLVARTRYYDQVLQDAIADGVKRWIGVGCGSDTRAFRFVDLLKAQGVKVLECDQVEAITEKQKLTERWQHYGHVEYQSIDLNNETWPELERWIGDISGPKTLLLMEGVSPYVNETSFRKFLDLLATKLPAGSHVAYDFKIAGVRDDFGREGRTVHPFRLPANTSQIKDFHAQLGLQLEHAELGDALCARLLPGQNGFPIFKEDGLVRLRVSPAVKK